MATTMLRLVAGVTLAVIALSTSGCGGSSEEQENTVYKGTVKGVEMCMERLKGQSVTPEQLRQACAANHEEEGTDWAVELDGGPTTEAGLKVLAGTVTNRDERGVVTGYEIGTTFYDKKGAAARDREQWRGLWLEPGQSTSFSTARLHPGSMPLCDKATPETERKNCWAWAVSHVWQVRIQ